MLLGHQVQYWMLNLGAISRHVVYTLIVVCCMDWDWSAEDREKLFLIGANYGGNNLNCGCDGKTRQTVSPPGVTKEFK